jgi:hypothetical protein
VIIPHANYYNFNPSSREIKRVMQCFFKQYILQHHPSNVILAKKGWPYQALVRLALPMFSKALRSSSWVETRG